MAIEILTPEEVGELLRLSANRVVVLARRGELPYLMIDGHIRFDARDVEDWLRYQRSDAPVLPAKMTDITPGADRGAQERRRRDSEGTTPITALSNRPQGL